MCLHAASGKLPAGLAKEAQLAQYDVEYAEAYPGAPRSHAEKLARSRRMAKGIRLAVRCACTFRITHACVMGWGVAPQSLLLLHEECEGPASMQGMALTTDTMDATVYWGDESYMMNRWGEQSEALARCGQQFESRHVGARECAHLFV